MNEATRHVRSFKRPFDEDLNGHGTSLWLLQTDLHGAVTKQLEIYEDGFALAYDESHADDEFGKLSEQLLDLIDFAPFEISALEFETSWAAANATNRQTK